MGDFIAIGIVILIFGPIIFHLIKQYKNHGHVCTCKACPVSKFVNKEGKIDLLFAVEQMQKEGQYESESDI
ncbi:MAG: FeoB-associated Cys-rich membrane protein [Tenericutes bacterium]|nr:FeoB-associated Cys-rich membrane protein [Mycoplasmatota bacterium]